jgi:hypothetical protein
VETTVAFPRRCGHWIFGPARRGDFTTCTPALVINGTGIRCTDNKLVNLTDIWKAGGGQNHKKPSLWLNSSEGTAFVEKLKGRKDDLLKITRGRFGGTFAHWQIALAYAKYLSPEFHIHCNNIIRRFVEEEQNPDRILIDL